MLARVNEPFCCICCDHKQDANVVGLINIVTQFTTGRYATSFKAMKNMNMETQYFMHSLFI